MNTRPAVLVPVNGVPCGVDFCLDIFHDITHKHIPTVNQNMQVIQRKKWMICCFDFHTTSQQFVCGRHNREGYLQVEYEK